MNLKLSHLKITSGTEEDFLLYVRACISRRKKSYCIPLNITKYYLAKKDKKLQDVINNADFSIADGLPVAWLSRRSGYKGVCRVSGIDLAEAILSRSRRENWKVFILGASPQNLEKALHNIKKRFNNPCIAGSHHGYFNHSGQGGESARSADAVSNRSNTPPFPIAGSFPAQSSLHTSIDGLDKIINRINALKPDILLLGMGMPQKEYFIHDNFHKIKAMFFLPVGGAIDIWAQAKKRAPLRIQQLGLEWLFRSFSDRKKALDILKYSFSFSRDFLFNHKH